MATEEERMDAWRRGSGLVTSENGSPQESEDDEYQPTTDSSDEEGTCEESCRKLVHSLRAYRIWFHISLVVFTILLGTAILDTCEHVTFLEAMYVITQVVTTVGYGDITVHTDRMRLFMSFYVLWLLVLVAYFMNSVIQNMLTKNAEHLKKRLRMAEMHVIGRKEEIVDGTGALSPGALMRLKEDVVKQRFGVWNSLIWASMLFGTSITFGTVFFHFVEQCSCSYGHTVVEGCTAENACEVGNTKTLVQAFYMSIVTLTTVGFGDVTPSTWLGRAVGIPWMFFGIISTGLFVDALQTCIFKMEQDDRITSRAVSAQLFQQMVSGKHDGSLDKAEFVNFVLVSFGLVEKETIEQIGRIFDNMDRNDDHVVTMDEVRRFQHEVRLRSREEG